MADTATVPDSHRDLLDRKVVALATAGTDGHPQVTAIWVMLDDDGVVRTSLTDARQKTKNMLGNPVATVFVIDPANPFRTLELRCDVVITPDPELAMMRRIVAHYGIDFETFPAPKEGRVLVELTPRHVVANG
jgi:PPOX class probable F420-dependent enzyme